MCGNHRLNTTRHTRSRGSPPRVREPPADSPPAFAGRGITPACAGTTLVLSGEARDCEDHPRVCGNHRSPSYISNGQLGSPPRVREPPLRPRVNDIDTRITPACAGTTLGRTEVRPTAQDHPRVCGNHGTDQTTVSFKPGSPPRVREPQSIQRRAAGRARITPACAGTTDLVKRRGHG